MIQLPPTIALIGIALAIVVGGAVAGYMYLNPSQDTKLSGLQNAEITPYGLQVTKVFREQSVVALAGVELCPAGPRARLPYTAFKSCVRGSCITLLDFGNRPIPDDTTIDRAYNGKCISQKITDLRKYEQQRYSSPIGISTGMLRKMDLTTNALPEKTTASLAETLVGVRARDGITVTLDYRLQKPAADEFRLGSKVVHIDYVDRLPPN